MWVLRLSLCVVLSLFSLSVFGKEKVGESRQIILLDQLGMEQVAKEKKLELSFVGLFSFEVNNQTRYCNALHINPGFALTSESCFRDLKDSKQVNLTFYDKAKKKQTISLPPASLKKTPFLASSLPLPEKISSNWMTAANIPQKDETWFGGFKPKWELVRTWGYIGLGEGKFKMQVNTCKAAQKIPFIQRVKQDTESGEEEILEELKLFDSLSPYNSLSVLEDCVKPVDESVSGALITLAKTFEAKLGILDFARFSPFGSRTLSALTIPEDRIFLRLIGADGEDHPLPNDLSSFRVFFSLPFQGDVAH